MYQGNFPEESFPSPMRSESAILGARASTLWEYDPEKEWLSEGIESREREMDYACGIFRKIERRWLNEIVS